ITWSNISFLPVDGSMGSDWWNLYDSVWVLISEMNGKGSNKFLDKAPTLGGPSFGQRARGLVESLNIPAAEVAAVVSGGIGGALGGKSKKTSRCVQQFDDLLPALVSSDDEQNKNRVQLFIWSLLTARSHYGMLDDAARFHIVTQLILETVNCAKIVLAASILGRDDSSASDACNNEKESGSILNLIQKDRILVAVSSPFIDILGHFRHLLTSPCIFSKWDLPRPDPGERTPLQRSDVGTAPPSRATGIPTLSSITFGAC
ncbi:hypothetical protein Taro_001302, partial [Colocasia esculenta]|nr:hypothetical protein [Colocasia esculenta]